MVAIKNIDFARLKRDLLNNVGPSGIWPLISAVDKASGSKLIELAKEYGLDIEDYIIEDEVEYENEEDEDGF